MNDRVEQPLSGGAQAVGLVRVDATVRRPRHDRSDFVQAVLLHLEVVGFPGAPRALGFDQHDREVLTYINGHVPHRSPAWLNDAQVLSATALIRAFHDATAASPLRGSQEVICHGDLGPHNTVFRGDTAVGFIDWDADLAPGRRIVDFAHAAWCFADVTEQDVPVAEQARKMQLMCEAYPPMTPHAVVEELTARFHRARAQHASGGRVQGAVIFDGLLEWMRQNERALTARR